MIATGIKMAVETIANIYRGTLAKMGAIDMKLVPKLYIVGAEAEDTDNARSATRNLPNPPVGARIAEIRPPKLFPLSKPDFHDGTAGAAAAKAAPTIWPIMFEVNRPR